MTLARPVMQRILERTEIVPGPLDTPCWICDLAPAKSGYAQVGMGGRGAPIRSVHRVTYEHFNGPVPAEMDVHHRCEVPACWCPDHLEALTRSAHAAASPNWPMNRRAAQTACKHGHPFTPENTVRDKSGWRRCRTCANARLRRRYAEHEGRYGDRELRRTYGREWARARRALVRAATVALVVVVAAACAIPPNLHQVVNTGALSNAHGNVAHGEPDKAVLCSIGEDAPVGYLIPAYLVVRWGGCHDAYVHGTGLRCDAEPGFCWIAGDDGTTPLLQPATVTDVAP